MYTAVLVSNSTQVLLLTSSTLHNDNFKVYSLFTPSRVEIRVFHSTFNSDNLKKNPHVRKHSLFH